MAGKTMVEASTTSALDQTTTEASFNTSTQTGFEDWIYWHYRHNAFRPNGSFKGLKWLKNHLCSLDTPHSKCKIRKTVNLLAKSDHTYSLAHTEMISKFIREANSKESATKMHSLPSELSGGGVDIYSTMPSPSSSNSSLKTLPKAAVNSPGLAGEVVAPLTQETIQVHLPKDSDEGHRAGSDIPHKSRKDSVTSLSDFFDDMDFLLPNTSGDDVKGKSQVNDEVAWIRHAPLVDAEIISTDTEHLFPQYGLLGSHAEARDFRSKLFLNTNVPFSAFLCGVQGSGKSHTASCILENALVPSKHLGELQSQLSALVFSYAPFSGDGVGFTISEAAFLASPDPRVPGGAHVKKVHVLVSPSNFVRISKLYLQLPNVVVTPYKIKPQDLDIDTMLTLMNVSESDQLPLYMAQVTQMLREMSTAGGSFDYEAFKLRLKKKKFNRAQKTMLQMRLDLLESFLDMDATPLEPHYQPGEITIMDMSCPFVDANMACILFRIGLKRYLQSNDNGKIIVLDEAHKYMLNVPGARALNETLLQTIRLERHYGARVIISTQEPTLSTDLVALCSVIVIHRFSSPQWLAAITRHVPTAEDRESLMQRIECLTTGTAIVYSPKAVFGRDKTGNLIKGTSRLVNVSIRRRITSDGGQSVLAV